MRGPYGHIGKIEGRIEGQKKLLRVALNRKFGVLPDFVEERIGILADESSVEALMEAILDAQNLDELDWN